MTSIGIGLIITLAHWAAPKMVVGDGFSPLSGCPQEGATTIAAAGGEAESLVLWLENDETARTVVSCGLEWGMDTRPDTAVYRVAPEEAGISFHQLTSLTAVPVEAGEQGAFLVRFRVPRDATPGPHGARVALQFDDNSESTAHFTVEVFDFAIPEEPVLPVLLGLDHDAMKLACGLDESVEAWRALYDLLAEVPAGFHVWPGARGEEGVFYDYSDIDLIKAHLDYAARLPRVPALEFGGPAGELLQNWPAPVLDSPQDPLQFLLFSIMATLEATGWQKLAVLVPAALPGRDAWQEVRDAYARVARADRRATRLLASPAHPYFERYTDLWALPANTPPFAVAALREGYSLERYRTHVLAECNGSEGDWDVTGTYKTTVEDAFDGCEVTAWRPVSTGDGNGGPGMECVFEGLTMLETLTILWPGVDPGPAPAVETAYHPGAYTAATVDWETGYGRTEGGLPASTGQFKYPRDCRAVRLRFPEAAAVAEILINQLPQDTTSHRIRPVQPWLDLRTYASRYMGSEQAGVVLRALPRFCWQAGFQGIWGFTAAPAGEGEGIPLISCGDGGVYPTIALFQLADGLEDAAYLQLYTNAARRGDIEQREGFRLAPVPQPERLQDPKNALEWAEQTREERLKIGRLLGGQRVVTQNFGPGRD